MRWRSNEPVYYWRCCDQYHLATSLADARNALETHERECHKGRSIGSFGITWKKEYIMR